MEQSLSNGNLRCEPGEPGSCPADCDLSTCGDLVCDAGETDCATDCGVAACGNGQDDDADGLVDGADPGCAGPDDVDEHAPTLPCDDGIDDDGDGAADFPSDPGCQTATSPIENPKVPGWPRQRRPDRDRLRRRPIARPRSGRLHRSRVQPGLTRDGDP